MSSRKTNKFMTKEEPGPSNETDEEKVARLMANPFWRLSNLYHIKNEETGQIIPFRPYPEQLDVFKAVLTDRHHSIIIPKARRRGMSTGIEVLGTDFATTNAGFEMGIVDRTASEATKKLKNICGVSMDKLPQFIRDTLITTKNNDDQISFRANDDAESSIYASTGYRGGNCNFLHVSEWGWIQCEDPKRSEEIQTGAIPAARKGIKIVETTWKGGKRGHLWEYTKQAMNTPEDEKHSRSWRIMFFPWHTDPYYSTMSSARIRRECEDYFQELDHVHGINLSPAQKRWYQEEAWPLRNNRFGEYPSTLEECFKSPMEGVIYDQEMSRMLVEKRITNIPLERGLKVFVPFDLGRNDAMPFGVIQVVGKEVRLLKYYVNHRESIRHYAEVLKAWGHDNKVPQHDMEVLLPHDGGRKSLETGKTLAEAFEELGFNVRVIPRIPSVWAGINYVKDTFPYLYFDKRAIQERHSRGNKNFPTFGECMDNYHQAEKKTGGNMSLEPVHDEYCHGADMLRTFCEGWQRGSISREASRTVADHTGGQDENPTHLAGRWR